MLIGNGWTDPLIQFEKYIDFGCDEGKRLFLTLHDHVADARNAFIKDAPVFEPETCDSMKNSLPRCKRLTEFCYRHPNTLSCLPASAGCSPLETPCSANGRSKLRANLNPFCLSFGTLILFLDPYDIRRKCEDNSLCYDVLTGLETWANRPDVRAELGVDDGVEKYESCQNSVGIRFGLSADK
jgi:cathepsin A (carboxypeptidase C)